MTGLTLDPTQTAVVVIDLQKGIVGRDTCPHAAGTVVANASRILRAARLAGATPILVQVGGSPDGVDRLHPVADEPGRATPLPADWSDLVPELEQAAGDLVILKRQWGAFYGTDLELQLRRRGLTTLVLCGIATEYGVESTARDAYERGFEQVFVSDAMSALGPPGPPALPDAHLPPHGTGQRYRHYPCRVSGRSPAIINHASMGPVGRWPRPGDPMKPLRLFSLFCCLALSASTLLAAPRSGEPQHKKASPKNRKQKQKGPAMVTTESGLKYLDTQVGTGALPQRGQRIVVHYTGWLSDKGNKGKKFDSSLDRNEPLVIPIGVGKLIKGWDEGILTMKVGGKRTLYIPAPLGYGARGAGGDIPPNADLIFEVELLGIQ